MLSAAEYCAVLCIAQRIAQRKSAYQLGYAGSLLADIITPMLRGSHAVHIQWASDSQSAMVQCRPAAGSDGAAAAAACQHILHAVAQVIQI